MLSGFGGRLQLTENDLLIVVIYVCYALALLVLATKFEKYLISRSILLVQQSGSIGQAILNGSLISAIIIINASIVPYQVQEDILNSLYNVLLYTGISTILLLLRPMFMVFKYQCKIVHELNYTNNDAACINEAADLLSSAIMISASLHYFYWEPVINILILNVLVEAFLIVLFRVMPFILYAGSNHILELILAKNNTFVAIQYATNKLQVALSAFVAASIITASYNSILLLLYDWMLLTIMLTVISISMIYILYRLLYYNGTSWHLIAEYEGKGWCLLRFIVYMSVSFFAIVIFN